MRDHHSKTDIGQARGSDGHKSRFLIGISWGLFGSEMNIGIHVAMGADKDTLFVSTRASIERFGSEDCFRISAIF